MSIEPGQRIDTIEGFLAGDYALGDSICASLEPVVRLAVRRYFAPDDADTDDVVQEVLVAFLGYLKRAGVAPDNPEAFVVTMARNRCLNLRLWRRRRAALDVDEVAGELPQVGASPLERLDQMQKREIVAEAMRSLDDRCRSLLEDIYLREVSIETLRRSLGLGSVQAVYSRRNACLRAVQKFLNRRLLGCLGGGGRRSGSSAAGRANEETDHG